MATVMSDPFSGTVGNTFAGDAVYSGLLSTAPKFVADTKYGVGLQFTAATNGTMDETFSATSQRVFDRVLLISATPSAACDFFEARAAGANTCKAGVGATGKLQLKNAAGTSLTGGTSANVLPVGTRFRLVINMNGTSLTAVIYNNDTDTTVLENLNPSGTIVSASPTIAREGLITAGGMGAGVAFTMFWPMDGDTVETGLRPVWGPWQSPPRRRVQSARPRPAVQLVPQPLAVPATVSARSRRPAALAPRRPRPSTLPLVAQVTAPVVYVPPAVRRRLAQLVTRRRPAAPLPSFLPASLASAPRSSRRPQLLFGRRPRSGFVPPPVVTVTPAGFVPGSPRPRRLLGIRRRVAGSPPFSVAATSTPTLFLPSSGTRRLRPSPRRSTATWMPPTAPVSQLSLLLVAPRRLARLLVWRRPVTRL
ncbi:MAG TPA: hypothetical protein VGD55_15180, partial [Acidothermaceae bacterium]